MTDKVTSNDRATARCNCSDIPPTMPTYRTQHFPICPMWAIENRAYLVGEVKEPTTVHSNLVAHYMARLRALMPYANHKVGCAYREWETYELLQKMKGPGYSAGKSPPCNCGFAVLGMVVWSEVGTEAEPVECNAVETCPQPDIPQEIVGYVPWNPNGGWDKGCFEGYGEVLFDLSNGWEWRPVYALPPSGQKATAPAVLTRVCLGCNTVHSGPLCKTENGRPPHG